MHSLQIPQGAGTPRGTEARRLKGPDEARAHQPNRSEAAGGELYSHVDTLPQARSGLVGPEAFDLDISDAHGLS